MGGGKWPQVSNVRSLVCHLDVKEKANLSVADVLKVGLERCEPLVGEAHHTGFMGGLAESYAVACDDCQDQVMAIAQADYSAPPD